MEQYNDFVNIKFVQLNKVIVDAGLRKRGQRVFSFCSTKHVSFMYIKAIEG